MSAPRSAVGQIFRAVGVINLLLALLPLALGFARGDRIAATPLLIIVVVTLLLSGALFAIANYLDRRAARLDH